MKLAYHAYNLSGQLLKDTIEAHDAAEATESLRLQGLFVAHIRPTRDTSGISTAGGSQRGRGCHSLKKLAVFTRQFHILIVTGTPIVEALEALERQIGDAGWQQMIGKIRSRIEEGTSLSEAMREHSGCFNPMYRSLIAAGESAGKLPAILERLSVVTRKQVHLRSNIVGALIYPCLLTFIAVMVLTLLVTFVVPRFAEMFDMLDAPLPASTRVVIQLGEALVGYWWILALAMVAVALGAGLALNTDAGRWARDTLVLRVPLIGIIVRSMITAHVARFLGILLDSHLPLLDSLKLLYQSTPNVHYANLIGRAEEAVVRGEALSSAFANTSLITPAVYQAMRSGENSGRMGPSLLQIADFMDEENEITVRSLSSIIEPVILIVLGLIVGLVALSMFTPLFDLTAISGGGT